jgi:hypothetical protein
MTSISALLKTALISAALAAGGFAAGCAQMSDAQCKAADWYQLGYVDGDIYGSRPRIDQYAYQCRAFGVQAEEGAYMAGWTDGSGQRATRAQTDCCGSR